MRNLLIITMLAISSIAASQTVQLGNATMPARTEFYFNNPSRVVAGAIYGKSVFQMNWDTLKVTSLNCDSCIVLSVNGALRPSFIKTRSLIPTTMPWDSITNKPTLVYPSDLLNFYTKSEVNALIPIPQTLSISGYNLSISNGNTVTLPQPKRQETYTLTTNASGVATVTFATYGTAPNVQAQVIGGNNRYRLTVTKTATSVTVTVVEQNVALLSLLGLNILTEGVTAINGATVDILVTAN